MNKLNILVAAGVSLALALTISCSSEEEGGFTLPSSSSVVVEVCDNAETGEGTMTCGGQTYRTVQIGEQIWMAENLNYSVSGSRCYDNLESNCDIYGRLYSWSKAVAVCPSGWHLPTDEEWGILVVSVGGSTTGGYRLKTTSGWNYDRNGSDEFGFSGLPAGMGTTDDYFGQLGGSGNWWTATEENWRNAVLRSVNDYSGNVRRSDVAAKGGLYSVRCIKD